MKRNSGSFRFLVVDCDPNTLETLSVTLLRDGYSVVGAASVEQALKTIETVHCDAVLTVPRLMDGSAASLISAIRDHWPQTTVIVLTDNASLELAIEAMRQGASDYLLQPWSTVDIQSVVARAVGRRLIARESLNRAECLTAANAALSSLNDELQRCVSDANAELSRKVDELARAQQNLDETNRQYQEFVSLIVHELNQPLTALGVSTQLLDRPHASTATRERALKTITNETHRLIRFVGDLRDASRLASGRMVISVEPFNVSELARETVDLAQAQTNRHTLRLDQPETPIWITADRERIRQVLSNLLDNAIKYSESGPVDVTLRLDDSDVVIGVRDCGLGIPPDRADEIFRLGVRLEDPRGTSVKGAGVGLYIAKAIVEAHAGRIWVTSPGPIQGSTFRFALPRAVRDMTTASSVAHVSATTLSESPR